MNIKIKWRDKNGTWQPFDVRDIEHMPRNHSLNLFLNSTAIIAKDGDVYLTNNKAVFDDYKAKGKVIQYFKDCVHSDLPLEEVGFIK